MSDYLPGSVLSAGIDSRVAYSETEGMRREIASEDLTESDVPLPHAGWQEIGRFALSFNGYEWWGSFQKCAEVANLAAETYRESGALPESLTDLRTCLFFEQRRWRHFGLDPDEEAMNYVGALVEEIRNRVCE